MPAPRPRFTKWGSTYYPKKYKTYLEDIKRLAKERYGGPLYTSEDFVRDEALSISIIAIFPRPKSTKLGRPLPDVDNIAKGVLDALHDVVYLNDKVVGVIQVAKVWGSPGEPGRIHIKIERC